MRITLIGKPGFESLIERLGVSEDFYPLPKKGSGYFRSFYRRRLEYPDTYLLFTNSIRGDLEAWLTRCPQRFGMARPGKKRPFLTDPFRLSAEIDETTLHQTRVWEKMARGYGLREPLDYSPLRRPENVGEPPRLKVGLICGTENAPEKRWPIAHWRRLIELLEEAEAEVEIILYGTPGDRAITERVAEGFPPGRVRNLAGQTDLATYCDELQSCNVVGCNDTGGMHLANLLGTSVVAIFGPTNPLRTGPVFDAPFALLQPEGCPATGGAAIESVPPERVCTAILTYLPEVKSERS
jgi:heptosyltransferase-2